MIVYKATNTCSNKIYIGMTSKTMQIRKLQHYNVCAKSKYKFHRALRKYEKKDFTWEVIDVCQTDIYEDLQEMEVAWINYYDSYNKGYNSTYGGGGAIGFKQTKETIAKRVLSNKGYRWSDAMREST